jgi:hypothetical protein
MAESYTCQSCGGVFEKTRSDEDAMREANALFSPNELASEGVALVCHECWEEFMGWRDANPQVREN